MFEDQFISLQFAWGYSSIDIFINATYFNSKNKCICVEFIFFSPWCYYKNISKNAKFVSPRIKIYSSYAPPSRPEKPRRYPDRGNAGGALVFIYLFLVTICNGCVYLAENSPGQKIHLTN